MRVYTLIFFVFCIDLPALHAVSDSISLANGWKMKLGGFLRNDFLLDSRKTAESVEGLFTLYPLPVSEDAEGNDLNAEASANLLSISSRLNARFWGPGILGASSQAFLEFDFTGTSNTNSTRLRQAYVGLNWKRSELLLGRTWHPMGAFNIPNVVALNTGAPFWYFSRSEQLRYSVFSGRMTYVLAAAYQSDYANLGPLGKSSSYLRNAVLPQLVAVVRYAPSEPWILGAGLEMKSLQPREYSTGAGGTLYKTNETLTTYMVSGFAQYKKALYSFKANAMYAQNATEGLMLGGYAVAYRDPVTGKETYTPTRHLVSWIGLDYGNSVNVGIFAGYIHPLGTVRPMSGEFYARGADIAGMFRIAPHLIFNVGNWNLASELEITTAAFGTVLKAEYAEVVNTYNTTNYRLNLMACWNF